MSDSCEDADLRNLTAISSTIGTPRLLKIMCLAAGFGLLREIDGIAVGAVQFLRGLINPRNTGFAAMPTGDQGIKRFGAADVAFPGLGIGVADILAVCPVEPSVEAIIAHAQRHITDAG